MKQRFCHFAKLVFVASTCICSTQAAPITVPNFSFEDPLVDDGQWAFFEGDPENPNDSPPGWTVVNTNNIIAAVRLPNPQDNFYPGTTGINSPIPGTGNGRQMIWLALPATPNPRSISLVSAASLASVTDNTRYTLTVALGNRAAGEFDPCNGTIQLLVNGVVAATLTTNAASLPNGTFTDVSTSFVTVPADPRTGGSLTVRLTESNIGAPLNQYEGDFDNVRVDATTLAPPATLDIGLYAGINITGTTGITYRIEYASSLPSTNWTTLTNILLSESPFFYVDRASVTNGVSRFYRAVALE